MASTLITAALAGLVGFASIPDVPAPAASNAFPLVAVQASNGNNGGNNNGQNDCRAAASQAVRETGGRLLSARPSGGVCVVIVLVPGKGNSRPERKTVRVPM